MATWSMGDHGPRPFMWFIAMMNPVHGVFNRKNNSEFQMGP
jgi:hypothetical protein